MGSGGTRRFWLCLILRGGLKLNFPAGLVEWAAVFTLSWLPFSLRPSPQPFESNKAFLFGRLRMKCAVPSVGMPQWEGDFCKQHCYGQAVLSSSHEECNHSATGQLVSHCPSCCPQQVTVPPLDGAGGELLSVVGARAGRELQPSWLGFPCQRRHSKCFCPADCPLQAVVSFRRLDIPIRGFCFPMFPSLLHPPALFLPPSTAMSAG